MEKDIKEIQVITFPALFVRSLAIDFEDNDFTWDDLYSLLFIKGTDIYREMRVTLAAFNIKIKDKVNYDDTFEKTKTTEVTFFLEAEDNGRKILTHGGSKVQTIVPKKSSPNVVLARMGYTQKVKKIERKVK